MKLALVVALGTLVFATPVLAAPKPCDELKTEIEGKIKANGVDTFTLEVVAADGAKAEKTDAAKDAPKDAAAKPDAAKKDAPKEAATKDAGASDGKVVGTCDGGTKQIVYKR
jgi:hypothetical protein